MKTHQAIVMENKVNFRFNFHVRVSERRKGFIVLHPVGPIDTITSPVLQNKVEHILGLKPEIILFDMQQVDFINTLGLRVFIKVQQAMKRRGGRVALTHFQPHIEKVFDIVNALPKEPIFASRHELDSYLETMQNRCSDYRNEIKHDVETECNTIRAENNANPVFEKNNRLLF